MTTIRRIHVPMLSPDDVIPHLGAPGHYRFPRSGWCIANHWFAANDLPDTIRQVLETVPAFVGAELVEGLIERHVELGDGATASQTDLLAILGVGAELAIMAVEGKVDETFGNLVSQELCDASDRKKARITRLAALFGINEADAAPLRYQLFHRTASAIFEAKRYRAKAAIMMVHSFDAKGCGFPDFQKFAARIGLPSTVPGGMVGPAQVDGIALYLGWTSDQPSQGELRPSESGRSAKA
jgi:hypothetical protein